MHLSPTPRPTNANSIMPSSRAVEHLVLVFPVKTWRRCSFSFSWEKGRTRKKVRKKTSKNQARKNVREERTIGVNFQCKIINTDGVDQIAR